MRLYYIVKWKIEQRYGTQINRFKIKRVEKKLKKNNETIGSLEAKNMKMSRELQNLYLKDSVAKMKEEGRI